MSAPVGRIAAYKSNSRLEAVLVLPSTTGEVDAAEETASPTKIWSTLSFTHARSGVEVVMHESRHTIEKPKGRL